MRKKQSSSSAAFTLLELVVATTLIFILGGAVSVLLVRGLGVWQRSDASLQQLFLMEKGLADFSEGLRNAVVLMEKPFEGSKEELSFTLADDPTRLIHVRYHLLPQGNTKSWVREEQSYPSSDAGTLTKTLIPNVTSFSIAYASAREIGGQKMMEWMDEWRAAPESPHPPQLIEVKVEAQDPRGKRHTRSRWIWIPHGTFGTQQ